MSTPDDLITWGRQQLDDDERVARASATHGPHWKVQNGRIELDGDTKGLDVFEYTVVFDEGSPTGDQLDHIARYDPARILAEIDARRRILDWLDEAERFMDRVDMSWHRLSGAVDVDHARRLLLLPFAGREGYREQWRP